MSGKGQTTPADILLIVATEPERTQVGLRITDIRQLIRFQVQIPGNAVPGGDPLPRVTHVPAGVR
jgi:hypothetical protein